MQGALLTGNQFRRGPGDTLRYTLRFRKTDQALTNFRIFDELDALPPDAVAGKIVVEKRLAEEYPAGAAWGSGTSSPSSSRRRSLVAGSPSTVKKSFTNHSACMTASRVSSSTAMAMRSASE